MDEQEDNPAEVPVPEDDEAEEQEENFLEEPVPVENDVDGLEDNSTEEPGTENVFPSDEDKQSSSRTYTSSGTYTSSAEMLAEVVLLSTSLGGVTKQFFDSVRARHLLDCKGLVYYLVDANKDISDATECKDKELLQDWKSQGFLKFTNDESGNGSVVIPQVIIDGVSVGDQKFLQDLEDDGDLDYIVARILCPSCLADKEADNAVCPNCNIEYKNIIPDEYVDTTYIRRFCQGQPC